MKNLMYLGVLIISIVIYSNVPSVIFYIVAIIITLGLFYYNFKFITKFRNLSIWKRVSVIVMAIVSVLMVLTFYFISHGYQDICTVGPNILAKNYFTGEVKQFYCGITPWYYEELPDQNKSVFPSIKNKITVTPTLTTQGTDGTYEIGKTYKMTWQNNSSKNPSAVSVEQLSKDGQSFGYYTLATSSISSAKMGSIDINISTWFKPKYNYRLVVFGDNREFLYESPELFTVVDNRPFNALVAGGADVRIDKSHIFEFGKPLTLSGRIMDDATSTIVYSSSNELLKNFAQVSIIKFSKDACEVLHVYDAPICDVKGEQAVTLEITAVMSEGTSYWITNRRMSLTPIGAKTQSLEGSGNDYEIELVSMDIKNKQATIIVRPVNI